MEYLDQPLSEISFVAFDTETTGLAPGSRLIEIAGIEFRLDGEERQFPGQLMDPQAPIPPAATNVNQITDEMVKGRPLADEILPQFFEFAENSILLAHNARFDLGMITGECERFSLKRPAIPCLDTHRLARKHLPGLVNYRLGTLAEHFGLETEGMHRAYQDTWVVMEVFLRIFSLLRLQGSVDHQTTLGDFVEGLKLWQLDQFRPRT